MADDRFWRQHLVTPLLLFLGVATLLELTTIDRVIGDWLFQLEGGSWSLKGAFWTSVVLHDWAKALVKLIALVIISLAVGSLFIPALKPYRRGLWYLAIAMPLSGMLVGLGKQLSHVACPWDLIPYGGSKPYIRLFEQLPEGVKPGKCFPGGHSSAGYTFLALYFLFREVRPEWRRHGLLAGLCLGLLFGLTQQLRGAHFISHDVWTAAIAWFNSLFWYWVFFLRPRKVPAIGDG